MVADQVVRHNGLRKPPDVTESLFTSHKNFNDINADENECVFVGIK